MALAAVSVHAKDEPDPWDLSLKVKPSLLHSATDDDYALAGKYRAKATYDWYPWRGPTAFAQLLSEGTVASDADINSENLFAELNGGVAFQLQQSGTVAPPPDGPRDPNAPPTEPPPSGGYRLGRLELSAKVRFETDQSFDNYSVTYGPQVGYFHNNYKGLWVLVPSVYADYQRVEILESSLYQSLGEDEDPFYRFSIVASWDIPIGEKLAPDNRYISPLGAIANVRYYQAFDVPDSIEAGNDDHAWYYELGLNYEFTDLKIRWLRSAYVSVARGRQPPAVENKTMVFVGVVLAWDKSKR